MQPKLKKVAQLDLTFDLVLDYDTLSGQRGYMRLSGGTLAGDVKAKVLDQAGDWPIKRLDGALENDVRIVLEAQDGTTLYLRALGLSTPQGAGYNMTCSARFDAPAGRYLWLTQSMFVLSGELSDQSASLGLYQILEVEND